MAQLKMTDEDRRDVTMLAFAETILCHIANRTKPMSRRHNQLLAAIDKVDKVDATYHGYMPDSYKKEVLKSLEKVEEHLLGLYIKEE
jgi:iron-sulfur cluster repair protein YtfE (RIC family)